ncbi:phosphate/phosphite/phosphonate ABC transporter substrate-binding protein [Flagellimonas nanhaiensis]|nr:PhnD/SsuA/transferrin family substrate-binding protein [Allomuricauda nanhaiensis]
MQKLILYGFVLIFGVLAFAQEKDTLVVATYRYALNDRIENLKPLSGYLSKLFQVNVTTKSYQTSRELIKAIHREEVDIAFINTFGYLLLASDDKTMEPLATLKVHRKAKDNYKTVLLANKSVEISDLQSLRGRAEELSIMFVSETSTSGNLVPRLILSSIGLNSPESQFKQLFYGQNHANTLEQLSRGKVDVCAVGSTEYFKQIESNPGLRDKINAIFLSDEIPLGPVLVRKSLSKSFKRKFTRLLLRLHTKNKKVLEAIKSGWSEAKKTKNFIKIDDSYYDSFRQLNGNEIDLKLILTKFSKP